MADIKPKTVPVPSRHPLIGAAVHRKDEHGRVENQAEIIDVIPSGSAEAGDLVLLQYYDWIAGQRSTRGLIRLRDMASAAWVFYADPAEMNEHYERVDSHRNERITLDLEKRAQSEKEPRR